MKSRAERHGGQTRTAPLRAGLTLAGLSLSGLSVAGLAAAGFALGVAPAALARDRAPALPATGPAADYPVVIGAPFVIDGVTYTPADTLNYDRTGYAVIDPAGGPGITIAHRTLPLPCYAEVTSLRTGKTVLVRVERRGPMSGSALVGLSPGAASQLGVTDPRTPIRIRRVNPTEPERALLRSGQRAAERMDTPMPLVGVLLRRLDPNAAPPAPGQATLPAAGTSPAMLPPGLSGPKRPAVMPTAQRPQYAPPPAPEPIAPVPKTPARVSAPAVAGNGAVVVQVGAFSSRATATAVAARVGGAVSPAGQLFRVRIGGFSTAAAASAALARTSANNWEIRL